jgi:hypothetical protein
MRETIFLSGVIVIKLSALMLLLGLMSACTSPVTEAPIISDPMISDPTPQEPGKEVGISIDVVSTGGVTLDYTWNADGGEIVRGQGSPAITYRVPEEPGTYNVRVRVEWDDQSVEKVTTIQVSGENSDPTPPNDISEPTADIPTTQPTNTIEPTSTPRNTLSPSTTVPANAMAFTPNAQVTYQTGFDDTVDYLRNWQQHDTVNIANGHLIVEGKNSGTKHTTALGEGEAILALFRYSLGTDANIVLRDELGWADKHIGIKPGFAPSLKISLGYDDEWLGGQQLDGDLNFAADHWYYVLIEIRGGGEFYIKVWDKDNPDLYREKLLQMGDQWEDPSWYGNITTNQYNDGKVEIDFYQELQLSSD